MSTHEEDEELDEKEENNKRHLNVVFIGHVGKFNLGCCFHFDLLCHLHPLQMNILFCLRIEYFYSFMLLLIRIYFMSMVDAGKSTTGGQILFLSGQVDD